MNNLPLVNMPQFGISQGCEYERVTQGFEYS